VKPLDYSTFLRWEPPPPHKRPEPPRTARDVLNRLEDLQVDWRSFHFRWDSRGDNFRLAPFIKVHDSTGKRPFVTNLQGVTALFDMSASPAEAVATARRLAINLFEHELDEWLFAAGLGTCPHERNKFQIKSRDWLMRRRDFTIEVKA
jgi:hypothetical protein